jgi:pimeloyl-ACP methyl ester carboxylesterase
MSESAANQFHAVVENVASQLGLTINQEGPGDQTGAGRTILVLHGGAGPGSVKIFASELAHNAHVITAIHPGFAGTERPVKLDSVKALAETYAAFINTAEMTDVLLIGFSIGGWIAAELALMTPRAVTGIILVDAVGITVPGESVLDVFAITPDEIATFSYHEPDRFRIDISALSDLQQTAMRANFAALAVYCGSENMQDPDLHIRLGACKIPATIVWGESDRIVTPSYGRCFADAFPNGCFELIPECGHLPQLEQPHRLLDIVRDVARPAATF